MAPLLILITFIVLIASSAVLLVLIFRKRQIALSLELAHYRSNYFNDTLARQMELQEYTYSHISREIHDNITLSLTLSKLYLNTITWDKKNGNPPVQVQDSIELISETLYNLNQLSKSLSPDYVSLNGLGPACEVEIEKIRRAKIFDIRMQKRGQQVCLSTNREIMILRILQEALHNVIKHSRASAIRIKLHYYKKFIVLNVTDNGQGFEESKGFEPARGSGLQNMKNRVILLGGSMKVKSIPRFGTSLIFKIPINYGN